MRGPVFVALAGVLIGCGALLGLEDDGVLRPSGPAAPSVTDASVPTDALSSLDTTAPPSCSGDAGAESFAARCPAGCCARARVPGGSYFRSWDGVPDGGFEDRSYPATVLAFELDTYEVVVGRFRAFVAAGMGHQGNPPNLGAGAAPGSPATGWTQQYTQSLEKDSPTLRQRLTTSATPALGDACTFDDVDLARDALPMGCVTWFEAFAFCIWDGGRLPTEAEWNYAAAGGAEQRSYPWSVPPSDRALAPTQAAFGVDGGRPVLAGAHSPGGDGRFGHADLAGNLAEWVFDPFGPYPSPCVGSCVATSGRGRLVRGGAYDDPPAKLLAPARGTYLDPPTRRMPNVGFRCARDIP